MGFLLVTFWYSPGDCPYSFFCLFVFKDFFLYFLLCWVLMAACRLSLVAKGRLLFEEAFLVAVHRL